MSIKLTETQIGMLCDAGQRQDRCLTPAPSLRGAIARKLAEKLASAGLAREVKAKRSEPVWRRDEEAGEAYALKLTAAGLKIARGEAESSRDDRGVEQPIDAIAGRAAPSTVSGAAGAAHGGSMAPGPRRSQSGAPREGSKIALVIDLLARAAGATIDELVAATDWLPHTTRAALTGLRKRGYEVAVDRTDRKRGTVYRIAAKLTGQEAGRPADAVAA